MRTLRLSKSATGGPSILLLPDPLREGQPKAQKLVKEMRQNHDRQRTKKKANFPPKGRNIERERDGEEEHKPERR